MNCACNVASVCLFFVSVSAMVVVTMSMGLVQSLAPLDMLARLMSLFIMVSFGMQPFAAMRVGYSAERLTTPVAIQVNGLLLTLGGLGVLALRPGLWRWALKQPKPDAPSDAAGVQV